MEWNIRDVWKYRRELKALFNPDMEKIVKEMKKLFKDV
jgi:hypothetical protein